MHMSRWQICGSLLTTIEVIASDRGALSDVPAWAKDMGHALKEQLEDNAEYHFVVEKG